jgi:hypothetical protein
MPFNDRIDRFLTERRAWIAAACCCFAALRVLVFAAGYPLFNPVDEPSHYEMVYEYSRGHLPGGDLLKSDAETARIFTLYSSSEYFKPRALLQQFHRDVPIAAMPADLKEHYYPEVFAFWHGQSNIETQSPPMYYLVAAAWYRTGELFGARDWRLAYWVRFLNAILYGAFVWLAFRFVQDVYPERVFLCAGVPLLLAVFPQDVFYGVNRDVLSPLPAAGFLLLLCRGLRVETGGERNLFAAGLLAGLAFLTDISNVILFGALLIALLIKSRSVEKLGNPSCEQTMIALSFLAAIALPALWLARNRVVMGDLTGSQAKIFYLGWVPKPLAEIWHHPIFTFPGARVFFHELIDGFWRGEIAWAGTPLRNSFAEQFYLISTLLLLGAFLIQFTRGRTTNSWPQRLNEYLSLYLVGASVIFMAAISLLFDFQECVYPSRAWPYFVSGRIIIGALLPFVVLYLSGLEELLRPVKKYVHPILPLLVICIAIVWVEVTLTATVFRSHFNFYALLKM